MHILFVHNTLPEYRTQWFRSLSNLSKCHFLFTNEELNQKIYKTKVNVKMTKGLNITFLAPKIRGYKELLDLLKEIKKYDYVELPPVDSFRELVMSHMICHVCRKNRIPMGYFWEKWEAPKNTQPLERKIKNWILRIAAGSIFHKVDIVFSGGTKSKEYFLENGVPLHKIVVLPNCSSVPNCMYVDLRKKYNIPDSKIIVLYFGRIIEQKGLDILIEAFDMLKDEKYFLIIAGDGEYKKYCEELVQKKKLAQVLFAGAVNPAKRKNYFEQCDIFIFPGTFRKGRVDVWGLTLNEALQFEKKLISTDAVGSAYDLIDNGKNGYRISPENSKNMSKYIKKTALELKKEIVHECSRKKLERHNSKNMAEQYLNNVKKIIEKRKKAESMSV